MHSVYNWLTYNADLMLVVWFPFTTNMEDTVHLRNSYLLYKISIMLCLCERHSFES